MVRHSDKQPNGSSSHEEKESYGTELCFKGNLIYVERKCGYYVEEFAAGKRGECRPAVRVSWR